MSNVTSECTLVNITQSYRVYKIIIEVYIVLFLCVAGILGNILSILVLGKDRTMRRTTAYLLQMVALADTFYLTTCIFFQTINTINKHTTWFPKLRYVWPHIEPYMWPAASIAQTCTVFLVVVLTADRYTAICNPLKAPIYSTTSRMRKAVVAIYIFAILYNIPRFFEREIKYEFDPILNDTAPCVVKSDLRNNQAYKIVYKTVLFIIVRFLIPLSLLSYFNTKLIQAIRRSSQLSKIKGSAQGSPYELYSSSQRNSAVRRREGQQHTRLLIVVVLVFILCEMPDFMLRIYMPFESYLLLLKDCLIYVNVFSNLCLILNSCTNFLIYCLLGKKFRLILCSILCKKRSQHRVEHILVTLNKSGSSGSARLHGTAQETYGLIAHKNSSLEHLYA